MVTGSVRNPTWSGLFTQRHGRPDAPADRPVEELPIDPRAPCSADIIELTERIRVAREFAVIATTDDLVVEVRLLAR